MRGKECVRVRGWDGRSYAGSVKTQTIRKGVSERQGRGCFCLDDSTKNFLLAWREGWDGEGGEWIGSHTGSCADEAVKAIDFYYISS